MQRSETLLLRSIGRVVYRHPYSALPTFARSMSSLVGRNNFYSTNKFSSPLPYLSAQSNTMNGIFRFRHNKAQPQISEKEIEQQRESQKIAYWSLGVDIFMTTVKGAVGWILNSTSIIADISNTMLLFTAHSLSSMVVDVVTLGCVKYCRRPPNKRWIFGYGKVETLSCLAVGGLLIGTAGGVFVHAYELFMLILHPAVVDPLIQVAATSTEYTMHSLPFIDTTKYYVLLNSIGVATVAGTIFVKYWIYVVSNNLAKKYDSNVLYANALHHRADALSSIVALAGLCGRYIGAPWLDPVGGAMVGYTILKAGYDICKDAMKEALDLEVDDRTRLKIVTAVNNVMSPGYEIEELLAHRSGSFFHTIVRVCPPRDTSLEDIFVNKEKIDNSLLALNGMCIFSVEMVNPYQHHRQLLLGGGAGESSSSEIVNEMCERILVPESSENEESIIPVEKDDIEVVICNEDKTENKDLFPDWMNEEKKN